jgi:hypothetical protein
MFTNIRSIFAPSARCLRTSARSSLHPLDVYEHPLDLRSIRSMFTSIRPMFTSINETLVISGRIRLFHAPGRLERRQAGHLASCPHPRHVARGTATHEDFP